MRWLSTKLRLVEHLQTETVGISVNLQSNTERTFDVKQWDEHYTAYDKIRKRTQRKINPGVCSDRIQSYRLYYIVGDLHVPSSCFDSKLSYLPLYNNNNNNNSKSKYQSCMSENAGKCLDGKRNLCWSSWRRLCADAKSARATLFWCYESYKSETPLYAQDQNWFANSYNATWAIYRIVIESSLIFVTISETSRGVVRTDDHRRDIGPGQQELSAKKFWSE